MRSAVGLIADQPKDLRAAFRNNLALFLDRGRVDPVLRVADRLAAGLRGFDNPAAAFDRMGEHGFLRRRIGPEAFPARAEEARERLLDDNVPPPPQRFDG